MRSIALFVLAAAAAIFLPASIAAQNAGHASAPAQQAAPAQATASQPAVNAATDNAGNAASKDAEPADAKRDAKAKAKTDTATCTPITAGPNQGQFIGKCRHKGI